MRSKIIFLRLLIIGLLFFGISSVYGVEDLTREEYPESEVPRKIRSFCFYMKKIF
ncbi:MAG: hypothetical protein ACFFEY_11270 [Candidatus Thorarchaeota archaeon]